MLELAQELTDRAPSKASIDQIGEGHIEYSDGEMGKNCMTTVNSRRSVFKKFISHESERSIELYKEEKPAEREPFVHHQKNPSNVLSELLKLED